MATVWNDNVSIIAATTVAKGAQTSGTIDLTAKVRARIFVKIGRGGTTALNAPISVIVRPLVNAGGASVGANHPTGAEFKTMITAATQTTCATSDSNSGQKVLNVTSSSGFANGQLISVQDSGGGVTRLEWARVSKVGSGTITLDRNLTFTHTSAGGDKVQNYADSFELMVAGGAVYEVVIDYGSCDGGTGDTVAVQALAQTQDS